MSNNDANTGWNNTLKPLLDGYVRSLLKGLEDEKIILVDTREDSITYSLNNTYPVDAALISTSTTTTTTTIPPTSQNILFRNLFDLRNIAKAIYQNLDYNDANQSHKFPLSRLLEKLEEDKAFVIRWKNKRQILETLDKLDNLSNDPEIEKGIEKELAENNFNPNVIITELLEFFGRQKVRQHFRGSTSQNILTTKNYSADWIVQDHHTVGKLYFNFKIRRSDPLPDKESLLRAIKQLEDGDSASYAFLVVFTYENQGSFDKLKFQFRQILLNDLQEFNNYTDRIKFIPISIGFMGQLDEELIEFKRTFIEDQIEFIFKNQPTPRGFSDRNDHILERTFDVKRTQFKIQIEPVGTSYWRFGLRFIQNETFPSIAQERHENNEVSDIHICVGDLEMSDSEAPIWKNPNYLTLAEYHVEVIQNSFNGVANYKGSLVSLNVEHDDDNTSMIVMSILIDNQYVGRKVYNLEKFKYCRLSAWCDYGEFELKTKIQITHNNITANSEK
ncbi:MAG: hypothetical protein JST50_05275 [Bacteroidetes bacterium]|jgi:hypothetical protein|nr:hypothetical protein [Bacteroidota bacterium]